MGNAKSQFGGYGQGNLLLDSLSVLTADTRGGLDHDTASRVAAMSSFVASNPVKAEAMETYVAKLTGGSGENRPAPVMRAKPGIG